MALILTFRVSLKYSWPIKVDWYGYTLSIPGNTILLQLLPNLQNCNKFQQWQEIRDWTKTDRNCPLTKNMEDKHTKETQQNANSSKKTRALDAEIGMYYLFTVEPIQYRSST